MLRLSLAFVLLLLVLRAVAECPNACSGHGKCKQFNVCHCDKNYMGNDCSERVCQFGRSHVDAPKGDLDMSKSFSGANKLILTGSQMYPKGTTEVWTNVDTNSLGVVVDNTGHGYSECSNAGVCLREKGECECFLGYEGSACQRVQCPTASGAMCSGHGVCVTAHRMAELDNGNEYKLWDEDTSRGCYCDPGFVGPACGDMECKVGLDPQYFTSPEVSARYANWSIVIAHATNAHEIEGTFTVTFYDVYGEDLTTRPITYDAPCREVIEAIEGLPNHYARAGTVKCLKFDDYSTDAPDEPFQNAARGMRYGIKYTVVLPTVVGKTKQPHVNIVNQDSGSRATIQSMAGADGKLGTHVYPNGFHGDFVDYAGDLCIDVDVTLHKGTEGYDTLGGLTYLETRLLMRCLGDSNGDPANDVASSAVLSEDFTWDYGSKNNPHLIKLVDNTPDAPTDICDRRGGTTRGGNNGNPCGLDRPPGFYSFLQYDIGQQEFRLYTPAASDFSNRTQFSIFTSQGYMELVSDYSATEIPAHNGAFTRELSMVPSSDAFPAYSGAIDCESNPILNSGMRTCVEKGNLLFFFANDMTAASHATNPRYPNMYTLERAFLTNKDNKRVPKMILDYSMQSSWAVSTGTFGRAYIFTPAGNEVTFVGPCSFRGECNVDSGQCRCHTGYYGQDCNGMVAVDFGIS